MAAPNIVSVTTIYGRTAVQSVTTTATAIVANTSGSNTVVKVNALYISNIDGSASQTVSVDLYRGGTDYRVVSTVSVPANSTLDVISKSIYLEEGDSLRITAGANSDLQAVCSYEVIA